MGHRSGVRHAAWLILATVALSVLPGPLAPVALRSHHTTVPCEHQENSQEQVDTESLKLLVPGQRKGHAGPTRGWLTLRAPRRHKPRPQFLSLSHGYEDPRRVLIPLRLDPPPDGRV